MLRQRVDRILEQDGLGWASNEYCYEIGGLTAPDDHRCEKDCSIGIPWEAEVSFLPWQRFGLGIKGYGNRNSAESVWGVTLAFRRRLSPG